MRQNCRILLGMSLIIFLLLSGCGKVDLENFIKEEDISTESLASMKTESLTDASFDTEEELIAGQKNVIEGNPGKTAMEIVYSGIQTGKASTEFYKVSMIAGATYLVDISVECIEKSEEDTYFILSTYNGKEKAENIILKNTKKDTILYTAPISTNMLRVFARGQADTEYTATIKIKCIEEGSPFIGGTYCSEGDSITAHNNWSVSRVAVKEGYTGFGEATKIIGFQSYVAGKYGMTVTNYGKSGNSILESLPEMMERDYSGYDLITISYGENDAREGVPIGELGLGDETTHDMGTFLGAYRTILDKIYTENPYARVVLMAPLQRHEINGFGIDTPNQNGNYLIDYRNAIESLAMLYSCKFYDGYGRGNYNQMNIFYKSYDGVHPNNAGYKDIAAGLLDVIAEYDY